MLNKEREVAILIKNIAILTKEMKVKDDQAILINAGVIIDVVDSKEMLESISAKEVIDGKGKLVMPGLIDAHMHTCQQLLRGRITDELPMIWTRIMVPYESNLQAADVKVSAELAFLEMIKSGTTGFIDAGGTYMDQVAETAVEAGLRGVITCSTMDSGEGIPPSMKRSLEDNIALSKELYDNFNGAGDGRLEVWYSLRSLISCSPALIERIFAEARAVGTSVQTHMNEYPNEVSYSLENFKCRPFEYLHELGVLGPDFLGAHGIHLSENEMDLIQTHGVKIAHCPTSNAGKGFTKTPSLMQRNVNLALGTDGAGHAGLSLFDEMKVLKSLMRAHFGAPNSDPRVMPTPKLIEMATLGGAKALQKEDSLGTIEIGKKADLILLNIDQPHIQPTHNLVNTLVESVNSNDVEDMIVNGEILMKNKEVLTLDEEKIIYESKRASESLAVRANL